MTSKKRFERYPLQRSPFYRMGRAVDLASILGVSPKELRRLIVQREALYDFRPETIGDKQRSLAIPIREMRALHERIKGLLERVILRDYLLSPRKGRTTIANAEAHFGQTHFLKLDVKQFYPSTTDEHVFQFFHHRLRMAADVAGRITKLCTIRGRVPFGSPLSPILCAHVHDDMFARVERHCQDRMNSMTLWVDDVAISGKEIQKSTLRTVARLADSKRLEIHKVQRARGKNGCVVTGTFVGPNGMSPSNKSHKKMKRLLDELSQTSEPSERLVLIRSLVGLTNHFLTTFTAGSDAYARLKGRLMWLHNQRREVERSLSEEAATRLQTEAVSEFDDGVLPW